MTKEDWLKLHFKEGEFRDPNKPYVDVTMLMDGNLIWGLERLRTLIDAPIIITTNGGYATQGHSNNSFHYIGQAADIIICTNYSLREQFGMIIQCGFNGIGMYPEWKYKNYRGGWHVDVGNRIQLWKENIYGKYDYFFTDK